MYILTWLFTFVAIYGTWLNANAKKEGFYWWLVSNSGFAIINCLSGQYALCLLFSTYLFITIKGIRTWK